jgi:hypothetical protein
MAASARIYANVAFAFGGEPALSDLLNAKYDTVIVFTVHVDPVGNLFLNNTQFVSGGIYRETEKMDLPGRLAELRKAGMEVIFAVGSAGVDDFKNIGALLGNKPGGPGNIIYENFKALKGAMLEVLGGDIDAIDFDNEVDPKSDVMINFGITLAGIGYRHVTLCPYYRPEAGIWYDTMAGLVDALGDDFVSAVHLQCYDGGAGNADHIGDWKSGFQAKSKTAKFKMIPGLATVQTGKGPWWHKEARGVNVKQKPNSFQYGTEFQNRLYTQKFPSPDAALQAARTSASFFFYCKEDVSWGGTSYRAGDTVFFSGKPHWIDLPQFDAYYLDGACTDTSNPGGVGACPADVQKAFSNWSKTESVDGGFIWFYDSMVGCALCRSCSSPITALNYRKAIRPDPAPPA